MLPILPPAPSRTDPANFSAAADAWVAALPAWTDAVNAIEGSLQASTLIGTSTTSLSVGTGAKGFASQAGKAWLVGAYLFIVAATDNTKVMQGKVTAYNSSTGSLVVDVNLASGSGTYSNWNIGVANPAVGVSGGLTVSGDLLLNTGNLGYTAGAGGTVTQTTSKSTVVTLNKPSGQIIMHNAALAPGASVAFNVSNSTIDEADVVLACLQAGVSNADAYEVKVVFANTGACRIKLTNVSAGSLSESPLINFAVIKGSTT